jgi:hypothetical protein
VLTGTEQAALRQAGRGRFSEGLTLAYRARLARYLHKAGGYIEAGDLVNASVYARRIARLSLLAWAMARGLPQDRLDNVTRTLAQIETLWASLMGPDIDPED